MLIKHLKINHFTLFYLNMLTLCGTIIYYFRMSYEFLFYFQQIGSFQEGFMERDSYFSLKNPYHNYCMDMDYSMENRHGFLKNSLIKTKFGKKVFLYIKNTPVISLYIIYSPSHAAMHMSFS